MTARVPEWPHLDWARIARLGVAEMLDATREHDQARADHIARCNGCPDCLGEDECSP